MRYAFNRRDYLPAYCRLSRSHLQVSVKHRFCAFLSPKLGLMSISDDDDGVLAHFLESEVLSEVSDQEEDSKRMEKRPSKMMRAEHDSLENRNNNMDGDSGLRSNNNANNNAYSTSAKRINSGILSKVPPELFYHIFKFLSSEDLFSCSQVCKFMNDAASVESLWRQLYHLRWGSLPQTKELRESTWKRLYIQRDENDMIDSVQNCPPEFREYYIQMHAAKRSQAPLLSQVSDDQVIHDKTVSDQVSMWKNSKGLSDKPVANHSCSGETCSYYQVGNVFVCEKTGNIHVCDETCREVSDDPANGVQVCTVSGRCFDNLLMESDSDTEQHQGGAPEEADEPFMGAGRFARAYSLGYNCVDEKELEYTLRFC